MKTDENLIEVCQREGRVLITLDIGFADIHKYPPEQLRDNSAPPGNLV